MGSWKRSSPPSNINKCSCGSDIIEEKSDGLARQYRCGDCEKLLADLAIGSEP